MKNSKMSLNIEQFKLLCDYDKSKNIYTQKKGDEYIIALRQILPPNNKNDRPFSLNDIISQPTLNDFAFSGKEDFIFICNLELTPMSIQNDKRKNEKIKAVNFKGEEEKHIFNKALGVAYVMTCNIKNNEHIIKFGQTRTTFKSRLSSYNCGVINNWRTASTTNIKMMQSLVANRVTLNLYLYDCSDDATSIEWRGEVSVPFASSKSLAVEDIMLKKFIEQYGTKPLVNIQASATQTN